MQIRKKFSEEIIAIFDQWNRTSLLWLHLQGPAGIGKTFLLQKIKKSLSKRFSHPVYLNLRINPLETEAQIRSFLKNFVPDKQGVSEPFWEKFPSSVRWAFREIVFGEPSQDPRRQSADSREIARHCLLTLAQEQQTVLFVDNAFTADCAFPSLLDEMLSAKSDLPIAILSCGRGGPGAKDFPVPEVLQLKKFSVREAESFVRHYTSTHPINARLITNDVFLRSGGNPRLLKFYLEALYIPILSPQPSQLLDSEILSTVRRPPALNGVFRILHNGMTEPEKQVFGFLSRLEAPMPYRMFSRVLRQLGIPLRQTAVWNERGWLEIAEEGKQKWIDIPFQEWRTYLKQHIPVEAYLPLLNSLKPKLKTWQSKKPLQISEQFFEAGDLEFALKSAYLEAQFYRKQGQPKRALDRLGFIKRNAQWLDGTAILLPDVLEQFGELQMQFGLFENAFENFREARELLERNEHQKWLALSLKMARSLYEMDALREARYILNELKIKKLANPHVRATAHKLMGDLEVNSGRAHYAVNSYLAALQQLPRGSDDALAFQIYSRLKPINGDSLQPATAGKIIKWVSEAISPHGPYRLKFEMDRAHRLMQEYRFKAAAKRLAGLYREYRQSLLPGDLLQLQFSLAEAEAALGKLHLARSRLKRLKASGWVTPESRLEAQLLLRQGVLEKEMARYGEAIAYLKRALKICGTRQLFREMNEIKIHLGHIYLLIHNFFISQDYLNQVRSWAEANSDDALFFSSNLFLCAYQLQKNQIIRARDYLLEAEEFLPFTEDRIDRLNYLFYKIQYLLAKKDREGITNSLETFRGSKQGMCKFEILYHWMQGKAAARFGDHGGAKKHFARALRLLDRMPMPHLQLQVLADATRNFQAGKYRAQSEKYRLLARAKFNDILSYIGDEILARQFVESPEFEDIFSPEEIRAMNR